MHALPSADFNPLSAAISKPERSFGHDQQRIVNPFSAFEDQSPSLMGAGWLWQGVAEAECRRAGDAAEEAYHKAFRRETTADEASMDAEHHRCMNVAMRAFDAVAIGGASPALLLVV